MSASNFEDEPEYAFSVVNAHRYSTGWCIRRTQCSRSGRILPACSWVPWVRRSSTQVRDRQNKKKSEETGSPLRSSCEKRRMVSILIIRRSCSTGMENTMTERVCSKTCSVKTISRRLSRLISTRKKPNKQLRYGCAPKGCVVEVLY